MFFTVIKILYAAIAVMITCGALVMILKDGGGGYYERQASEGRKFLGLVLLIFGNIFWRLFCEFMIVLFRINHSLKNIDENTGKKTQQGEIRPLLVQ
jgi:hypothetical protein